MKKICTLLMLNVTLVFANIATVELPLEEKNSHLKVHLTKDEILDEFDTSYFSDDDFQFQVKYEEGKLYSIYSEYNTDESLAIQYKYVDGLLVD